MKNLYLVLAILGTAIPYLFFGRFIAENGLDIPLFVSKLFENGAVGGFTTDLLFTSFVFWFWSWRDKQKHGVNNWWLIPLTNLTIGLSCTLPLYFYLRERRFEEK